MSTVDAHFDRKILEKMGIIYHNSIMKHIAGRGTVQAVFGHILYDRTAEGNIDDLHALADPDDRDSGGIAMSRAWNCRMSSSVSTVREPLFFSPKKAGVISPPPGRIRASQEMTSPGTKVVTVLAGSFRKKVS